MTLGKEAVLPQRFLRFLAPLATSRYQSQRPENVPVASNRVWEEQPSEMPVSLLCRHIHHIAVFINHIDPLSLAHYANHADRNTSLLREL